MEEWPVLAALLKTKEVLDELDGRRVQINHTIEHVDRIEAPTASRAGRALKRADHLRRMHSEAVL